MRCCHSDHSKINSCIMFNTSYNSGSLPPLYKLWVIDRSLEQQEKLQASLHVIFSCCPPSASFGFCYLCLSVLHYVRLLRTVKFYTCVISAVTSLMFSAMTIYPFVELSLTYPNGGTLYVNLMFCSTTTKLQPKTVVSG